jgi:catechol 2,3-dioxygenase-like lactoylglutathione lyase family enzyme
MAGISHIVIEVSELKKAEELYRELGFESLDHDRLPGCGHNVSLRAASGQWLVLTENAQPRSLPETGVHQAYRVSAAAAKSSAENWRRAKSRSTTTKKTGPPRKTTIFIFTITTAIASSWSHPMPARAARFWALIMPLWSVTT